ncbi:MAG: hypothetical protein KF884_06295 [Fimbriimonadaceae bacterium]|nr:hypothetical protein [Fimbriimonadaceae bacterium]QYK59695.1 MAG: hypothetical protein KF884_06295 [Fimbriimonadaceae bacterium]
MTEKPPAFNRITKSFRNVPCYWLATVAMVGGLVPQTSVGKTPLYRVDDLSGIAAFPGSHGLAINDFGQVAGRTDGHGAWLWDEDAGATGFDEPGTQHLQPIDVNNLGVITGRTTRVPRVLRGFIWRRETGLHEFAPPEGNFAVEPQAVNDFGQVVGYYYGPGRHTAFQYVQDNYTYLGGKLPYVNSLGDVTQTGLMVGNWARSTNQVTQRMGYLLDSNLNLWLFEPPSPSQETALTSANLSGLAVGVISFGGTRPVFWRPDIGYEYISLPFGKFAAAPVALNDHNDVLLRISDTYRVVVTRHDLGPIYVDEHLDGSGAGWDFSWGQSDMNNKGQIVGTGSKDGQSRAFLISPISTVFPTTRLRVLNGRLLAGTVEDLAERDGRAVKIGSFPTPNQPQTAVSWEVEATLPSKPVYLWLKTYARTDQAQAAEQTLELWRPTLADYPEHGRNTMPLGPGWIRRETVARGGTGGFVADDGTVRARVTVRPTAPTATPFWAVEHDQVVFEAVLR